MKLQPTKWIVSPPNRYRMFSYKCIMVLEDRFAMALVSIYEYHHPRFEMSRVKEQVYLFIRKQRSKSFEFLGTHIEIHYKVSHDSYFWVTGYSTNRFIGPCLYYDTVKECEEDARRDIQFNWNEEHKYDH